MLDNQKVCVILSPEGIERFTSNTIKPLLKDGKYFLCNSVQQNGYFLDMKVCCNDGNQIYELSIPLGYVLYIISFDVIKQYGFKTD